MLSVQCQAAIELRANMLHRPYHASSHSFEYDNKDLIMVHDQANHSQHDRMAQHSMGTGMKGAVWYECQNGIQYVRWKI